jgi:hypothetical protein
MNGIVRTTSAPAWYWGAAGLGTLWNVYGVVQFLGSLMATPASLMEQGLTSRQAEVMTSYPTWMTVAFAVGVFGGLAGCILLLLRRAASVHVLALSLAAYVLLYVGDITEGVFAAMGAPQIVILSLVVAIAAGLLWLSRQASRGGLLS